MRTARNRLLAALSLVVCLGPVNALLFGQTKEPLRFQVLGADGNPVAAPSYVVGRHAQTSIHFPASGPTGATAKGVNKPATIQRGDDRGWIEIKAAEDGFVFAWTETGYGHWAVTRLREANVLRLEPWCWLTVHYRDSSRGDCPIENAPIQVHGRTTSDGLYSGIDYGVLTQTDHQGKARIRTPGGGLFVNAGGEVHGATRRYDRMATIFVEDLESRVALDAAGRDVILRAYPPDGRDVAFERLQVFFWQGMAYVPATVKKDGTIIGRNLAYGPGSLQIRGERLQTVQRSFHCRADASEFRGMQFLGTIRLEPESKRSPPQVIHPVRREVGPAAAGAEIRLVGVQDGKLAWIANENVIDTGVASAPGWYSVGGRAAADAVRGRLYLISEDGDHNQTLRAYSSHGRPLWSRRLGQGDSRLHVHPRSGDIYLLMVRVVGNAKLLVLQPSGDVVMSVPGLNAMEMAFSQTDSVAHLVGRRIESLTNRPARLGVLEDAPRPSYAYISVAAKPGGGWWVAETTDQTDPRSRNRLLSIGPSGALVAAHDLGGERAVAMASVGDEVWAECRDVRWPLRKDPRKNRLIRFTDDLAEVERIDHTRLAAADGRDVWIVDEQAKTWTQLRWSDSGETTTLQRFDCDAAPVFCQIVSRAPKPKSDVEGN